MTGTLPDRDENEPDRELWTEELIIWSAQFGWEGGAGGRNNDHSDGSRTERKEGVGLLPTLKVRHVEQALLQRRGQRNSTTGSCACMCQ